MWFKYILFSTLLFSVTAKGQIYKFDTFAEYEYIKTNKSPVYKSFELTNSKDNTYIVSIVEKDDKTFVLFFMNDKGITAEAEISKNDFFKAESIDIKCVLVIKREFSYDKVDLNKYNYHKLNDTIIKKDTLHHYVFRSDDSKTVKKYGEKHIIIQKNTDHHMPNLTPWAKSYIKWKENPNALPNGLTRQTYIKVKDEIVEKTILLQYTVVNKIIFVEEDCD